MKKCIILLCIASFCFIQLTQAQTVKEIIRLDNEQWYRIMANDDIQKSSNGITFQKTDNLRNLLPSNRITLKREFLGSSYIGIVLYYVETYKLQGKTITKYLGGIQGQNWKEVNQQVTKGVAFGSGSAGNKQNTYGYWSVRQNDGMVLYSLQGLNFSPTGVKALIKEYDRENSALGQVFALDGHLIMHYSTIFENRGFYLIPKDGGLVKKLSNTNRSGRGELIQHPKNPKKFYSPVGAFYLGNPAKVNDPDRRNIVFDMKSTITRWAHEKNINYAPTTSQGYTLKHHWIQGNYYYITAEIRVAKGSQAYTRTQTFMLNLGNVNDKRLEAFDARFEPTDKTFIPKVPKFNVPAKKPKMIKK